MKYDFRLTKTDFTQKKIEFISPKPILSLMNFELMKPETTFLLNKSFIKNNFKKNIFTQYNLNNKYNEQNK